MANEVKKTREQLLEDLARLTRELAAAKRAKLRDAAAHNETIGSIGDRINAVMEELDGTK
jgi:hypothetical protein